MPSAHELQKFRSLKYKGSSKNFLWASQLWVGRRKESILGYVPKNNEIKNSGSKELMTSNVICIAILFTWFTGLPSSKTQVTVGLLFKLLAWQSRTASVLLLNINLLAGSTTQFRDPADRPEELVLLLWFELKWPCRR